MDTPNMLRGEFYSTHITRRCPAFSQCNVCKMCVSYTPHHAQCQLCEGRKHPRLVCECLPRTRDAARKIERAIRGPMFDPDRKDGGIVSYTSPESVREWDEIAAGLNFSPQEG